MSHPEDSLIIKELISRIEDLGSARTLLLETLKRDVFDDLSKHSRYWKSENEECLDKLDDARRQLMCVQDDLYTILNILGE